MAKKKNIKSKKTRTGIKQKQKQKQTINIKIGNVSTKSDGKSDKQQTPLIIPSYTPSYIPPPQVIQSSPPSNPYNMEDIKKLIDSKFSDIFKPIKPEVLPDVDSYSESSSETSKPYLDVFTNAGFTNPQENVQSYFSNTQAYKQKSNIVSILDKPKEEEEDLGYIPFSGEARKLDVNKEIFPQSMKKRWETIGEKLEEESKLRKAEQERIKAEQEKIETDKKKKKAEMEKLQKQREEERFIILEEQNLKQKEKARAYIKDFIDNYNENEVNKNKKKEINKNLDVLGLPILANDKNTSKIKNKIITNLK